jgi:hypothetical protein
MKRDLKYYQDWMSKWTKVLRFLYDKKEQTHKVKYLSQEIKKHIWLIEWRLLCVKWFDIEAESSSMFPKTLKTNKQ